MKPLVFWQVDAFSDKPFHGNPAAVYVTDKALTDKTMQKIAIEHNLSETAFVLLRQNENPLLRWFTPTFEIDLCGHATLAAAHVLFSEFMMNKDKLTFDTKFVGELTIKRNTHNYAMSLPKRAGECLPLVDIPDKIISALSFTAQPLSAFKARDLVLVYENEDLIREMNPDFSALKDYPAFICVTAPSLDVRYDFISRFFCANDVVVEDPVTGSAHCTLGPYWAIRLKKTDLRAYQASERGGELFLKVGENNVEVTGKAITVMKGEMFLKRDVDA